MGPDLIRRGALRVAGLWGDGADTAGVWARFERMYDAAPFQKADECGYEVRFFGDARPGRDFFVGFLIGECAGDFQVLKLPASEYASFDVKVANGYDSENAAMNAWLADHAAVYAMGELDGRCYAVECYNEKFLGGDGPDCVVEIWVPIRAL